MKSNLDHLMKAPPHREAQNEALTPTKQLQRQKPTGPSWVPKALMIGASILAQPAIVLKAAKIEAEKKAAPN